MNSFGSTLLNINEFGISAISTTLDDHMSELQFSSQQPAGRASRLRFYLPKGILRYNPPPKHGKSSSVHSCVNST